MLRPRCLAACCCCTCTGTCRCRCCRYPEPSDSGGSFRDPVAVDLIVEHNELAHALEDEAAEWAQQAKEDRTGAEWAPRSADGLAANRQAGR
jgi:hypothetical protein